MFSGQGIPNYYCGEPAMGTSTDNYWPNNQYALNPQFFPNIRSEHFQNGVSQQHSQVPYIPLTPEPVLRPVFHLPRPTHDTRQLWHMNVVQPRNAVSRAIVKRRRKRTVFTTEQIEVLEEIFKSKQYLTREERQVIVEKLQLSDKPVKTWFQNRRLKCKKESEIVEEEETEERSGPDMAKLEFVESQINEKTDEFGYVTLDDGLMRNLFDVMDDALTNNAAKVRAEDVPVTDDCPIYEPISPASVSDSNDDDTALSWEPAEPDESLQILSELQALSAFKS